MVTTGTAEDNYGLNAETLNEVTEECFPRRHWLGEPDDIGTAKEEIVTPVEVDLPYLSIDTFKGIPQA